MNQFFHYMILDIVRLTNEDPGKFLLQPERSSATQFLLLFLSWKMKLRCYLDGESIV